ncbi:Crp/Fnr family transcriptional regulator [Candidatus Stoquefichus massiliensis]|uniref:Crp/Fnr family transcriptional regulator n=1 Tax=Candidatus Stoquefichus massiliensis TaxID=1470350 RepID=UPI00048292FB|nr:Crp/Fnr family transcriptional regulator [Candidatus Stoquefichus massiliensis]
MKIKENLFHYFEKAGTKVKYHPQDIIYMQEDDANNLYLIIKGRVRVYVMTPNGEEITLEIIGKGRIFGESSFLQNSSRPTTVEAIGEVELISCYLDDLYPYLSESKDLTISLLQLMSQTCDYLSSLVKKAYTYNRYEKIASFLLEQTTYNNFDKGIISNTLTYTHEEIASLVGLSRVTTTKVLNQFAKKKYILNEYKKITVINKKALSLLIQ